MHEDRQKKNTHTNKIDRPNKVLKMNRIEILLKSTFSFHSFGVVFRFAFFASHAFFQLIWAVTVDMFFGFNAIILSLPEKFLFIETSFVSECYRTDKWIKKIIFFFFCVSTTIESQNVQSQRNKFSNVKCSLKPCTNTLMAKKNHTK